jgi:hypothetical protein
LQSEVTLRADSSWIVTGGRICSAPVPTTDPADHESAAICRRGLNLTSPLQSSVLPNGKMSAYALAGAGMDAQAPRAYDPYALCLLAARV